jgi:hypothetical protein
VLLLILAAVVSGALVSVLPTWGAGYLFDLVLHPLLGLAASGWIVAYMRRHLPLPILGLCTLTAVLGGALIPAPYALPTVAVVHLILAPCLLRGPAWVAGIGLFFAWQLCLASGLGQLAELWRGGDADVAAQHLGLSVLTCVALTALLALVHRRSLIKLVPVAILIVAVGAGHALWPRASWSLLLDSQDLSAQRLTQRSALPPDTLSLQETCEPCHADAVHSAALSAHAISTRTPHYQKVRDLAISESVETAGEACDACHAPQALLGDDDTAGLSCTACHLAVDADTETGILTLGLPSHVSMFFDAQGREHPPGAWGVAAIQLSPLRHAAAFQAPVLSTDRLCLSCHRDQIAPSVTAGLQPIRCAECHLQGDDHFMPGANAALTRHANAPESAARLLAWIGGEEAVAVRGWEYLWNVRDGEDDTPTTAVWLTLFHEDLSPARRGEDYAFRVQSSNVGAPHAFPSGDFSLSEAWLELEVTDASGRTLLATPRPSLDAGTLPPEAVRLGGALLDAEGAPITHYRVWETASRRTDGVIGGGRHRNDDFTLSIPPDAEGPLQITGTWRYRKMSPDFAQWAYGAGAGGDIPSIALGRLSHEVKLR